jgi:hypothetical protein
MLLSNVLHLNTVPLLFDLVGSSPVKLEVLPKQGGGNMLDWAGVEKKHKSGSQELAVWSIKHMYP